MTSEHAHLWHTTTHSWATHTSLCLLGLSHNFLHIFLYHLHEFWVLLKVKPLYRWIQLLFFDPSFFEKFILCFWLLNHHFHHHHHLALLRLWILHAILHHGLHRLHLDLLLDLESSHNLFLGKERVVITSTICSLLLHLHDLHTLRLVLAMVHGIPLEFLLR